MKRFGATASLPSPDQWSAWGADPTWSQTLSVPSHDGQTYNWHVLTSGPANPIGTIVCIHGNPTWSYLWRSFIARFADRYRVVAVDQLGMGFSERTAPRRYATRVRDLDDVLRSLSIDGPVIVAAHDWGGAIAMGWAVAHQARVAGLILCNTGIAVPAGTRGPSLIRFAAATGVTDFVGRRTPIFVGGTTLLSGKKMTAAARRGYLAPYRRADQRTAIASFVADVPFSTSHPSAAALNAVAQALPTLDVPVLLAWGGRDPVFSDAFADDLAARFRRVDRHRFAAAGHLVVEEADVAGVADTWLTSQPKLASARPAASAPPLWAALERRADDASLAFFDGSTDTAISWADLHTRVQSIAAGLRAAGVQPGDRAALLVTPGPDLAAIVYGCWRAGVVTVVADKGLGLRGLGRALRGAGPQWLIGPTAALAAARTMRWAPGAKAILVEAIDSRADRAAARLATTTLAEVISVGTNAPQPPEPSPDDLAAVLFTSGATGPAKGVRYRHSQLAAQRDALIRTYAITPDDRLVAAFAPFALYGPALGIASGIPDVDVTKPGALTATAFANVCDRLDATIAFASPAALANVIATATNGHRALESLRLVLSAGAPVAVSLLRQMAELCPSAELHTPYGMTEVLPVADVDLATIERVGPGRGVNVGHPVPGASVRIAPLSQNTGRVLVSAPWLSDGYDRLFQTEAKARTLINGVVWHDSGDVGHLDSDGALWIEGRGVHCITTVGGLVTPVPIEVAVEHVPGVTRCAAVGVGPVGVQQIVVVVEGLSDGLASETLTASVRHAVDAAVAAVLTVRALPVDIRHNAKIDRAALAVWAAAVLDGRRASVPR